MKPKKSNFSQENFMSGFAVGMAAGAVAMYLFGTDEGEEIRTELKEQWQLAAKELLIEGKIENAEQDLWQLLKDILAKANQEVADHSPESILEELVAQAPKRHRKTQNLFKGL